MIRMICCAVVLLGFITQGDGQSRFLREGNTGTVLFDDSWKFARFGMQADGSTLPEPTGVEATGYPDNGWQQLDLPHDWAIAGPFRIELAGNTGKLPWKGIGWYRKHFTLQGMDRHKRVFLDFDGAMAYAKIWVNGSYAGTWPYGYSSFRMDITPYLKADGKNVVAVRLDTEEWDSRWYPGAGIYRHVWLVETSPVHVGHWGTYITTSDGPSGSAEVQMKIQ
ncbi:MAG TPA: beta galactosidase jelly roll domain-containing protein, partial [Chitinophaga sp.]|uniref:sugar-binding domain-containing protein n=1 Tax=Chitinophaga sp. TaxID=1869181 RepID=UPI002CB430AA